MDRSLYQHQIPNALKPARAGLRAFTFPRYTWGLLGLNLFIVVWGAVVRATGSGAGCGNHWPSCNGEGIPQFTRIQTAIEFFHRATSGIALLMTAGLVVWAFIAFPKGHRVRLGAVLSMAFIMGEALIGAGLVLYKLVEHDATVYRTVAMSAHLTNTLLLVGALTLTAWWGAGASPIKLREQGAVGWMLGLALCGATLVGITGAIAALSDTLFPASNLAKALQQDISPSTHFLIHLRFLHPLLAISAALYIVLTSGLMTALRPSTQVQRFSQWTQTLVLFQIGLGIVNLLLLAPMWMQLIHLLVSELLWISLVLLTASALSVDVPHVELTSDTVKAELELAGAPTWKDYLVLTKPRVISLLLFTTWMGMVIAAKGWPGFWLFTATGLGLYMAAGASNAINMVLERDLDVRMERTATRPTVTHKIPPRDALKFAFVLATGSFALLWSVANLLSALMALAGLVVYIVVYTLLLKRRTWSNIVIGGAAGAFPPLVGYTAVTNNLSPLAWCLFAIIFLWTPVHFWALAILIKDDYAKAGVPMLPVVKGERHTVIQIAGYAILTAMISAAPLMLGVQGPLYIGAAILLNAVLLWQSFELWRQTTRPRASKLFHFSMLYLALLFLAMALDRSFWGVAPVHPLKPGIEQARADNRLEIERTF